MRMRPSLSCSAPFLLYILFSFLGCSMSTITAATPMPPSVAPTPSSSGFHPTNTDEEACHLMVDVNKIWLGWYPHCVVALRSNSESHNATIHELAVLALKIVEQDAMVELRRLQELRSRGFDGDPQELEQCWSGFDYFIPILQSGIKDLQKDGRVGFEFFFNDIQDFVDCRDMQPNPVVKQSEILALLQAVVGICKKYCKYLDPKPCTF